MSLLQDGQEQFFAEPPDYLAAKALFERVVEERSDWIEGHHWLASSYEALNQTQDAESAYRSAMICDREDPRPQVALGGIDFIHRLNAGKVHEAAAAGRYGGHVCENETGS